MEFYLFFLLIVLFICILSDRYKLTLSLGVLIFLFTLFSGVRYNVGTDFSTYELYISYIRQGIDTYMEPGFEAIVKATYVLGFSGQLTFVISSLLVSFFFLFYIREHSYYLGLSSMMFLCFPIFYLASFNGIRQFIAVAIFLYSIKYILHGNIFKYFCGVAIACSFHSSAVITVPLYFILNHRFNKYKVVGLCVFIYFFIGSFPTILENAGFSAKYTTTEIYSNSGFDYKLIVVFSIYILLRFFEKKYSENFPDYNIMSNMLVITCVVGMLPLLTNLPSSPVVRITSYFSPALLIVIPNILSCFKNDQLRIISYFSIIFTCILYYITTLLLFGNKFNLLPYQINIMLF